MRAGLDRLAHVEADCAERRQHARVVADDRRAVGQNTVGGSSRACFLQCAPQQVEEPRIARMVDERAPAQCLCGNRIAAIDRDRGEQTKRSERVRRDGQRALARVARRNAIAVLQMEPGIAEPDVLDRQALRLRRGERRIEASARHVERSGVGIVLGELEQRTG
jgi:hypothetical protein